MRLLRLSLSTCDVVSDIEHPGSAEADDGQGLTRVRNLALLGQFFVGYRVTFVGSLIGFSYGFATGFITGYLLATLYNWFGLSPTIEWVAHRKLSRLAVL